MGSFLEAFGLRGKFNEIDKKLQTDDEIVKRLSDVVLQLRVVTKQTEMILRELQGDVDWMNGDEDV
jgi:hypothetical protein